MIDNTPTVQQARVMRFILDFWFAQGFPPTLRDIIERFEFSSPESVMCHLRPLIRKGFIRRVASRPIYAPTRP